MVKRFGVTAAAGLLAMVAVSGLGSAGAQDTRTVTEPVIPPSCTVLKAKLAGANGLAPEDETKFDTERIQKALDGCAPGKAVELAADGGRAAFLTAPLNLRKGVTLLVDKGVTLFGSRNPEDYALRPGACGVVSNEKNGCKPLIAGDDARDAGIMGDGIIDGRGGAKMLVAGKESDKTWWDLSEIARKGGHQQNPRLITLNHCDNFTIYRITLKNAGFFHVTYNAGDGFTVWGLKIDTPRTARNTDGVDPGNGSKNITVTHSFIRDGDDNIAIKGGGSAPTTNMTVIHNHFYYGHGMSIGSGTEAGVSKLRVSDLSLDGTDAGVRIKSQEAYGGLVHDAVYEDLCIRNSRNPVILDTNYQANPQPGKGKIPVFVDITIRNARISGGGQIRLAGFDVARPVEVRFDNVLATDALSNYRYDIRHAKVTLGPGPVNFPFAGEDLKVTGTVSSGTAASCADKFVPFPEYGR